MPIGSVSSSCSSACQPCSHVHHVLALSHRNTEGDRLDAIETNEVEGLIHRLSSDRRRRQALRCLLDPEGQCESPRGFNRTKRIADMEGRPAIFKIDGGRGPDADFAIEPVDHRIERNTQSDQCLMVEFWVGFGPGRSNSLWPPQVPTARYRSAFSLGHESAGRKAVGRDGIIMP